MKIDEEKYPKLMGLSKITLKEYPYGHVQTITYGPKRIGKSIYYILIMMDMYAVLYPDMSLDERFKKAMDNTLYTIDEFIAKIKGLIKKATVLTIDEMIEKGIPELAIHVDDAGVGFNKYKYFSNRQEVEELKSIIDTIGIVVTGLYMSSPTLHGVLGFLQEYEGYRIHIIKAASDFRREARIYKLIELPSGQMRIRAPKKDPFKCWLPNDLYKEYYKKRKSYLQLGIKKLEDYRKGLEKRRQRDPDLEKTIASVYKALRYSDEMEDGG